MTTVNCTGTEELDFTLIFGEDGQQHGPAALVVGKTEITSLSWWTIFSSQGEWQRASDSALAFRVAEAEVWKNAVRHIARENPFRPSLRSTCGRRSAMWVPPPPS
ncbi:unnamed protein product [Boreogadus saida]